MAISDTPSETVLSRLAAVHPSTSSTPPPPADMKVSSYIKSLNMI